MPVNIKIEKSPPWEFQPDNEELEALAAVLPDADSRSLRLELDLEHVELVIRNKLLRLALDESDNLCRQYAELFSFARVGYWILSSDGKIQLANQASSKIVGIECSHLLGSPLVVLIIPRHRDRFENFLKLVFNSEIRQFGDFELADESLVSRIVTIEACRTTNGLECSAMMVGIMGRSQAQEQAHLENLLP